MNEAEGNPEGLKTDKTEGKERAGKYWEHHQVINHKHNNTITKIKNVKHKESKEIQTQNVLIKTRFDWSNSSWYYLTVVSRNSVNVVKINSEKNHPLMET